MSNSDSLRGLPEQLAAAHREERDELEALLRREQAQTDRLTRALSEQKSTTSESVLGNDAGQLDQQL